MRCRAGDGPIRRVLASSLPSLLVPLAIAACSTDDGGRDRLPAVISEPSVSAEMMALLGGDATSFETGVDAYSRSAPNLTRSEEVAFEAGSALFRVDLSAEWSVGFGPLWNAASCASCHPRDGRGAVPKRSGDASGLLLRLSRPSDGEATEAPVPAGIYGTQLQDHGAGGVTPEGRVDVKYEPVAIELPDGESYGLRRPEYNVAAPGYGGLPAGTDVSPRLAPPLLGLGLLEAIDPAVIENLADPDDLDGDGISGRPNWITDADTGKQLLGRFGWKANTATMNGQIGGALAQDHGLGNSLVADPVTGSTDDIDEADVASLTFYSRTLAVPAARFTGLGDYENGQGLFVEAGCADCHVPTLTTGDSPIAALSNQTIHPYTDLLLHDMGPELADGRRDHKATGSEWRTSPLWGIGLNPTVNGNANYLHDGRARTLMEAILWHGGEAQSSRDRFAALTRDEREELIAFLGAL